MAAPPPSDVSTPRAPRPPGSVNLRNLWMSQGPSKCLMLVGDLWSAREAIREMMRESGGFLTEQVLADVRGTVVGFVELTRPATQAEIDEWDVVVRVLDPRERRPGDVVEVVYTP
jgi:hypothetical protein